MATTGFTLLDSVLFSRLPFPNGDRFVLLDVHTDPYGDRTGLDPERFLLFSEHASLFDHLGAFRSSDVNLTLPSNELVAIRGTTVTPESIAKFPYAPVAGRMLRAEDGRRGAPPVALIR